MSTAFSVPRDVEDRALKLVREGGSGNLKALLAVAMQHGVAHKATMNSSVIICHYKNRGNFGIAAHDMQSNLSLIAANKWHDELFQGICTDIAPSEMSLALDFNNKIVAGARGTMAPIMPQTVTHMSLAGGHTNFGHRAVLAKCPHPDPDLCMDGHLCIDRIREKCTTMANRIETGAQWIVIKSWFLHKYDGLADAIQASANQFQNVTRQEHDVQMLTKIAGHMGGGDSFAQVQESFKKTRPKNIDSLPNMFHFIRKHGGQNMEIVNATCAFLRSVLCHDRKVSNATFEQLHTTFQGGEQMPRFRNGLLAALYADENPNIVPSAVVKSMAKDNKKRAVAKKAEDHLSNMNDIISNAKMAPAEFEKAMNEYCAFAMRVSLFVLDKKSSCVLKLMKAKDIKEPDLSIEHFACLCVESIEEQTGVKITTVFDAFKLVEKQPTQPPSAAPIVGDWTVDDKTTGILLEAGFKVGNMITGKGQNKDDNEYKIMSSSGDSVTLALVSDPAITSRVKLSTFQNGFWKIAAEGKVWHLYQHDYFPKVALI